ncbi:MAG: RnfH family protein [Steroidobacteraceae bacterium]
MSSTKNIVVAYATPQRQILWQLQAPIAATVRELLAMARAQHDGEAVPWDTADVGIFGELCDRETIARDGDRIELYRPLLVDPKESRRVRARRRGGGSG